MTTALLDGDLIVHRNAAAHDEPLERVSSGLYRFGEAGALAAAKTLCLRILADSGADDALLVFSSKHNFRKQDVLSTYKGNRTGRKPILFAGVRRGLMRWKGGIPWTGIPRLEADDVMGLLQTKPGADTIICSYDKDMRTIPGRHFSFCSSNRYDEFAEVETVTPADAERLFYQQAISGDPTDGYAGAPGFGAVTASKFIEGLEPGTDLWQSIVDGPYKGDELEALTMARCARILRHGEYDYKKKEVQLWTPPK